MHSHHKAIIILGALVYGLLFSLGYQMDTAGTLSRSSSLLLFAAAFFAAFVLLSLLFPLLSRAGNRISRSFEPGQVPFLFPLLWGAIFACFLPMFLVYYPGSFMYDTQYQTFLIVRGQYDMIHPLLHTLLLRFALSFLPLLGTVERCAALYSLLQMLLLSLCFAGISFIIFRRHSLGGLFTAAFFCLYPSHMAMASNCIKDTLFAGFFALFLMLCLESEQREHAHSRYMLTLACGTLACLLRNNMVYAMAAWALLLLLQGKRARTLCSTAFLCILLSFSLNTGMRLLLRAAPGERIEMFSVPIQQLSRAWRDHPECFSEDDLADMDDYFPGQCYTLYDPTLADPVKEAANKPAFEHHLSRFLALWGRIGLRCPGTYLEAFTALALPSLFPYHRYRVSQAYLETGLQKGVLTEPFGFAPMVSPQRFASLRSTLNSAVWETGADRIPVLGLLMNTGFIFWTLFFLLLVTLYRGRSCRVLLLALLLYATCLLGPVMQGRYVYPFLCALPIFLYQALGPMLQDTSSKRESL